VETSAFGDHSSSLMDSAQILTVPPQQQSPFGGCCNALAGVQEGLVGLLRFMPFPVPLLLQKPLYPVILERTKSFFDPFPTSWLMFCIVIVELGMLLKSPPIFWSFNPCIPFLICLEKKNRYQQIWHI
jgi:hypothetical protein